MAQHHAFTLLSPLCTWLMCGLLLSQFPSGVVHTSANPEVQSTVTRCHNSSHARGMRDIKMHLHLDPSIHSV